MNSFDAEGPDLFYVRIRKVLAEGAALLTAVLAFGSVTAAVVGLQKLGFNLFSLVWLGVVPIGALLIGIISASGYYASSLLFNVKPTKLAGWAMLLMSLLSLAVFYFFQYLLAEGPGSLTGEGFYVFVDQALRHMKFAMDIYGYRFSGSEMGSWGYAMAVVQLLALVVGGFVPYAVLMDKPYCDEDRKFHQRLLKFRWSFKNDRAAVEGLRNAEEGSRTYFDRLSQLPPGNDRLVELELSRCPQCGRECLIERVFFAVAGKQSFQDQLHRFIWVRRGRSLAPELQGLKERGKP